MKGYIAKGIRNNHIWTDEERDIVRRDYQHTHASAIEIGKRLGVTGFAVRGQVQVMGLGKALDRKPWDDKQDDQLRRLMEQYCARAVARAMNRSLNSVVLRSKRIGIHRRCHTGWFTKMEVCAILARDHHYVDKHISLGNIKATWHHEHEPKKEGCGSWHIEEADLVNFIRRFPEELIGHNIDIITIVDILAGVMAPKH